MKEVKNKRQPSKSKSNHYKQRDKVKTPNMEGISKSHHARIRNKQYAKTQTKCLYANQCGACQLLHLSYEKQLQQKQLYINKQFSAYGKVEPIIGMEDPIYYRNKVHAVFKKERYGSVKAGTYREGTHQVISIKNCLIEDERASQIIQSIYTLVQDFKYSIFDEDTLQGFFRHVLVRVGKSTGEILVVLVTGTLDFPSKKHFIEALLKKHPEITSIVQNINGRHTNMILGEREKVLYGKGYIEDKLCGCKFKISAQSFYQVNPIQTEKLYQKAIELAELTGKEIIVDAYCGIGTIGIIASKKCKEVFGVEVNAAAIKDACLNGKINQCKNVHFTAADASEWMVELSLDHQKVDVVIMDPPRAGSTKRFMDAVIRLAPQKIIYISCNPETLKRDLDYLTHQNYKMEKLVPVDLFPYTTHVESMVKLNKLK